MNVASGPASLPSEKGVYQSPFAWYCQPCLPYSYRLTVLPDALDDDGKVVFCWYDCILLIDS